MNSGIGTVVVSAGAGKGNGNSLADAANNIKVDRRVNRNIAASTALVEQIETSVKNSKEETRTSHVKNNAKPGIGDMRGLMRDREESRELYRVINEGIMESNAVEKLADGYRGKNTHSC